MWRIVMALVMSASIFQACVDKAEIQRTAFDPPQSADDAVRGLTRDLLESVEKCDFQRVDAIVRPGRESVVPSATAAEDPESWESIAEEVYYRVAHCEYKIELKAIDVGHATYDPFREFPDAIAVSVEGEQRFVTDSETADWEECLGRYHFSLFGAEWRLVSSWMPCIGGHPSS